MFATSIRRRTAPTNSDPAQSEPFTQAHELNRGLASDPRRTAQRYLQRVLYGNLKPLLNDEGRRPRFLSDLPNPPTDTGADWLFEARFDYGELDEGSAAPMLFPATGRPSRCTLADATNLPPQPSHQARLQLPETGNANGMEAGKRHHYTPQLAARRVRIF